jgi:hypothetical protein
MSNPGDALGHTKGFGASKADEYYSWKLMQERMAVWGDSRLTEDAKQVLGANSQREAIKFQILKKLTEDKYAESTANYALLCSYTEGRTNKLDQAEYLAEKVFENMREKAVLNELIPASATLTSAFGNPSSFAAKGIGGALAGLLGVGGGGGTGGAAVKAPGQ